MNERARSEADRQRLDKWLWFARLARTRAAAVALVEAGCVRVNSVKATTPARPLKPGDVLTVALEREVRVLRVCGLAARRGPYETARLLYDDLGAPPSLAPSDQSG